jgi:predicted dehydrogenase
MQRVELFPCYSKLQEALCFWNPDYVVIANRTSQHYEAIRILIEESFTGYVLVEKPLFEQVVELPSNKFSRIFVAYNFRFSPLILNLKKILEKSPKIISANIYVGSYLPDWRANTDYRECYSAQKQEGGGVLRDLSHELDYISWLFGSWQKLTALGGKFSSLEIDSDDLYSLLIQTNHCSVVTLQMSYLDRVPRRHIVVNTNQETIVVDLCKNTITINGVIESFRIERDDTYRTEHQAILTENFENLCTLEEAKETLLAIQAAEKASSLQCWVTR